MPARWRPRRSNSRPPSACGSSGPVASPLVRVSCARSAVSIWGPELTDFTLTMDTRMQSEGVAGYHIFFRFSDGVGYVLFVTAERLIAFGKAGRGDRLHCARRSP